MFDKEKSVRESRAFLCIAAAGGAAFVGGIFVGRGLAAKDPDPVVKREPPPVATTPREPLETAAPAPAEHSSASPLPLSDELPMCGLTRVELEEATRAALARGKHEMMKRKQEIAQEENQ